MEKDALEIIVDLATRDFRKRLEEAFAAGGEKVRRDLLAVLAPNAAAPDTTPHRRSHDVVAVERPEGRASPGTVKPTIVKMIETFEQGISMADIIEKTGFKENSVRGTLATLRAEGFAERRGNRWIKRVRAPSAIAQEPQ